MADKDGRISTYTAQIGVRVDETLRLHHESPTLGDKVCVMTEDPSPKPSGTAKPSPGPTFTPQPTDACYYKRSWEDTQKLETGSTKESTPRVAWLLTSVKDPSGNEMRYSYNKTVDSSPGNEFLVSKIAYTYGPGGLDAARYVQFDYENRADTSFRYVNGVRYASTQRLKTVSMFAPNPGATALVRRYNLSYEPIGTGAGLRSRSMLSQVQMCGSAAGCAPAKRFTWSGSVKPSFTSASVGGLSVNTNPAAVTPPSEHVADLNGDGLDDLVLNPGADGLNPVATVRLGSRNTTSGAASPLSQTHAIDQSTGWPSGGNLRDTRPVDVDGDGKTELAVADTVSGLQTEARILHWDGSNDRFDDTGVHLPLGTKFTDVNPAFSDFADVNGDGLPDFVAARKTTVDADKDDLSVALNKGDGTFAAPVSTGSTHNPTRTPWSGRCPGSRVADVDGDGRADVLVDREVLAGEPNEEEDPGGQVHTASPIVCGVNQGTVALSAGDDGKLTEHSGGAGLSRYAPLNSQRKEWTDHIFHCPGIAAGPLPVPICSKVTPQVTDETHPNALYGVKTVQGDFNGDGLPDTLMLPNPGDAPWLHYSGENDPGVILWGTGVGQHWDGTHVTIPRDKLADLRVDDVNGDGMDDIVSFYNDSLQAADADGDGRYETVSAGGTDHVAVLLAQGGNRGFVEDDLGQVSAGVAAPNVGRALSQLGDFNGDNRVDLVEATGDGHLKVLTQDASEPDRIIKVGDKDASWDREVVEYSNDFTDRPQDEAGHACDAPLVCVKRGMPVVRKLTSRENAFQSGDPSVVTFYDYADPVAHRRQGFLGFGTVHSWTPSRPRQVTTKYDVRTSLDGGHHYPFASMPHEVTTVTPILTPGQVTAQPGTVKARISRTFSSPTFRVLGDKRFAVFPHDGSGTTWEDGSVSVDWATSLAGSGHDVTRLTQVDDPGQGQKTHHTHTSSTYDDYGNLTHQRTEVTGGTTTDTATSYDLSQQRQADWLTGLPDTVTATAWEPGADTSDPAKGVTRHVASTFDGKGRLQSVTHEKGNADTSLTDTTTYTLDHGQADGPGVLTQITESAAGRPDGVTHLEYSLPPIGNPADPDYFPGGQPFPGQPEEEIDPVQTWTEHTDTATTYRPSQWQAIHPAFGVSVATEDINGMNTATTLDDLGRVVHTQADGTRPTDITYASSFETGGGRNGSTVTATTGQRVSTVVSDTAGATRKASGPGFDGTKVVARSDYDRFGRQTSQTRPTFSANNPPTASTVFDSLNRPVDTTGYNGKHTTADYDFTASTTTSTDPLGHTSTITSDEDGRVLTTEAPFTDAKKTKRTASTSYTYAPFGLVATATTHQGKSDITIGHDYDVRGREIHTTDPDRGDLTTTYYGTGLIHTQTHDGTGNTQNKATYSYDDLDRPTAIEDTDGQTGSSKDTTSYTWDTAPGGSGQLAEATSPDRITTHFGYDDMGHPTQTSYEDKTVSPSVTYTTTTHYDPTTGLPDAVTYPQVGNHVLSVKNVYNAYDNLKDVTDVSAGSPGQTLWHTVSRNADQALTGASLGPAGSLTLERTYDPDTGQVKTMTATNNATTTPTTVENLKYTYGDTGLVKEKDDLTASPTRSDAYGYNEINELTGWDLSDNNQTHSTGYDYDEAGNLTSITTGTTTKTRTYGQPAGSATTLPRTLTSYTTGAAGSGAVETYHHDGQGRQTSTTNEANTTTRAITYTPFNLPHTITTGGKTTTFAYDAFGTRIKKTGGADGTVLTIP
ncbi:FG-GAP-like repeat-containing protein, partial [Streptomyces sp. NPDC005574]|uniref:FG-GAP-like repeat-containing protein n=1 Tax=Streptomyces sp. NPDC005574 TaxID=3156891 RepID=UPI0033A6F968